MTDSNEASPKSRLMLAALILVPIGLGVAYWGAGRYQCHQLSNEVQYNFEQIAISSERLAMQDSVGMPGSQVEDTEEADGLRQRLLTASLDRLAAQCTRDDLKDAAAKGQRTLLDAADRIMSRPL